MSHFVRAYRQKNSKVRAFWNHFDLVGAVAVVLLSSSCATAQNRVDVDMTEGFSDPDLMVDARICMDDSGSIFIYPNTNIYSSGTPSSEMRIIPSDIWSRQYLITVAPVGGLERGECKRVPKWDSVAFWTNDNYFDGANRSIPWRDFRRPLQTPDEIESYRMTLDFYKLRQPGDSSGVIDGVVWPRQGY